MGGASHRGPLALDEVTTLMNLYMKLDLLPLIYLI
jgi:hypothetical protein